MTKISYQGPDRAVGKVVARLSRKYMTLFIHTITGHNNLNYINSLKIPDYTPLCRSCKEEDESFQHFYEECPVFWRQRMEIQEDREGIENWTIRAVLKGTLKFADMEGWNVAETEGWKVTDTIFSRVGMWPTLFFLPPKL